MTEIRIHGRGGQGSVTMAELIAEAAFFDGKFSQGFPNFGVERRGAPVTAFARIDKKYIRLRSQVYEPDYIIIQDPTLLSGVDVLAGAKKGTVVLINTEKKDSGLKGVKVKTLPATGLALEAVGKPIVNTAMLGAFAALSGLISLEAAAKAIRKRFIGDLGEKNVLAAKKGFEAMSRN